MKKRLYKNMVELTRNPLYTKMLKTFTASKLSGRLNRSFVKVFDIDQNEMERELHHYRTLNELFVRKLKSGVRPVTADEKTIISPVDGLLSQIGTINETATLRIKNKDYRLSTMLGFEKAVKRYSGGIFMLFYLSPRDYHRIHSPMNGKVVKRWALGKYSEPVNQWGLLFGDQPLAKNYRLITELEANNKRMAMVKVGALNVNSVHPVHLKETVEIGEEMAYFSFGSTVILLFEKGMIHPIFDETTVNYAIKQGQKIAELE
ncbi:phosphatidylserine decarboxylase [Evansella caseinilytica]|uniref:phosphatidylserine decarboxylase n=1 Tax=Evansella caseinilytica TaxID=1503961 RepID=A0A1H3KCP5_9BACI|nr:phosphatidylserine decarboxylase [Evansella caseinilytica]SDY49992.1 phosphatidylserine decarboxylase [Evansella caseinilytica]